MIRAYCLNAWNVIRTKLLVEGEGNGNNGTNHLLRQQSRWRCARECVQSGWWWWWKGLIDVGGEKVLDEISTWEITHLNWNRCFHLTNASHLRFPPNQGMWEWFFTKIMPCNKYLLQFFQVFYLVQYLFSNCICKSHCVHSHQHNHIIPTSKITINTGTNKYVFLVNSV